MRQRGAASIEFAFMFVLVFMVFYGMVGYFIPLLLSATYHELSAEALRQAVSLQYASLEHAELQHQAKRVIQDSWLPAVWAQPCPGYGEDTFLKIAGNTWSTCIRHGNPSAILTPITLPLLDLEWPPLPKEIRGETTIRLH